MCGVNFTLFGCEEKILYNAHIVQCVIFDQFSLGNIRSGKMKVPEWVDLVNTNNRFVLKLFLHLLSSLSRAQVIELLFTGRSLPPMMRIGSTSAQLPWPATCTSGLASFYTFCAPYLWCAHIYLENNVTLNHLRSEKKLLCKSTSKQGEDEFRLTFL